MNVNQITLEVLSGGQSSKIAIGTTSAQTAAVTAVSGQAVVSVAFTPDVDCFVRRGTNPTAVSDGTDQFLLARTTYRCQMLPGEKLAFIASGAGNVYFTPGC